ncbi:hypothetical protein SAMN05421878_11525 [Actinobaculum suis]|uniref:Cof family hydrolase n=1 Tax=Actinobaculum suis TaxID=1657 RepID=A0A0K9ETX6_9ACTO|nr:HAD family hydrolase [Actinobaculum suis]KMY23588.1 hypothetical protein ACU19_04015 [Actinobaculum suis]MDY5153224.1 HAD family hydrolase [Actinobaculum suis]OCA93668.1 hypothetical protein ACU20_08445 [Actinobaculum suis]OCA94194.1 hypothetical protein ACU21_08670 [Actinobaculum suis]SDE59309.1 hypothetical protein SAMN05421878_11525 [Actinobaculum suis]
MANQLDYNKLPWEKNPSNLVFDIDGTLTDERSQVSERTLKALRTAAQAGFPLTLATGRMLYGATNVFRRAGVEHGWVVAGGGAIVWDGERIVRTFPLGVERARAVIDFARRQELVLTAATADELYAQAFNLEFARSAPREVLQNANEGRPIIETDLESLDLTQVLKMGLAAPAARLDELAAEIEERFPGSVRGHAMFYDVQPPGVDKWVGISEALRDRGLLAEETLGVGDSDNDAAWLAQIGMPIAVANASALVSQIARWQLPDVEDPVAHLIDSLITFA